MGLIVTVATPARIANYIQSSVDEGTELVVGGRALEVPGHENGYWLGGTLFDNVSPEMQIYREVTCGPVLSCVRAPSFAKGLQLNNDHEFGNGVSSFTRDGNGACKLGKQVQVGMADVNAPIA